MNENVKYTAAGVAVVGLTIGGILYFSQRHAPAPPAEPVVTVPEAAPAAPAEDVIEHPLAAPEQPAPLPALNESDGPVHRALSELLGKDPVERFFVPDELVRHLVVTIDNLSTEKVAERIRPLRPVSGPFAVTGTEDAPILDPANYQRYEPLVQLIRTSDTQDLIAAYVRYYPLFQEAYESLGHPPRYFNDRVIVVIDHLLATPDVHDPIALARPNVQYEFADPKLEALSAGQKSLIRMGSQNAAIIKQKLREVRSALIAQKPEK